MIGLLLATVLAVSEPPSIDTFLKDLAAKRADVRSVAADFVQEDLKMEQKEKTTGSLLYVAPRRIIFRYKNPEIVYLIDALKVYEYDAELEQVQIYDVQDAAEMEALYMGFESNPARLQEAYTLDTFMPVGESRAAVGLMLEPKGERRLFEKVRLYLQGSDYLPCLIQIVNDADSEVMTRLSDLKVNGTVKPEDITIMLPEGTTIIDNGKRVGTVGPEGKRIPEAAAASDTPKTAEGAAKP